MLAFIMKRITFLLIAFATVIIGGVVMLYSKKPVVLTANAALGDEGACPNWAGPSPGLTPLL